ncbi:hypothetical protein GcC1_082027, partial [Golovinomyces cichoracearum]
MSNSTEERYPGIEIDRSLWKSTLVNPQDLTPLIKQIANTYLLSNLKGLLREHLRTNDVWTAKKQGVSMTASLAQIVEDENENQGTVEEIESQLNEGSFNSKHGQPISSRVLKFDPSTGQRNSRADIIKPDLRAQTSDSGGYFTQFNPPHFETEERRQQSLSKWHTTTLARICQKNPELSMEMCFEMLIKELQKAQLAISSAYQTELCLRDTVINTVRDIPECSMACYKPAATFEALCADIRASIATALRIKQGPSVFPKTTTISPLRTQINQPDEQLYTD